MNPLPKLFRLAMVFVFCFETDAVAQIEKDPVVKFAWDNDIDPNRLSEETKDDIRWNHRRQKVFGFGSHHSIRIGINGELSSDDFQCHWPDRTQGFNPDLKPI